MSITKHKLHLAQIGSTLIDPLQGGDYSPEVERLVEVGSGRYIAESRAIGKIVPTFNLTTTALKTVLGITGLGIYEISASAFTAWLKKRKPLGMVDVTGHKSLTVNKGVIIPRQISATKNQKASMSLDVLAFKDGTNYPIVVATDGNLPAYGTAEAGYVLSHAVVETVTLLGMRSLTVSPGYKETTECEAGDAYASYCDVETLEEASISFTCLELDFLSSAGLIGKKLTSAASFYLQKIDPVNPAGRLNEFIKFGVEAGMLEIASVPDENGAKALGLKVSLLDDGDQTPVTVDTAYVPEA